MSNLSIDKHECDKVTASTDNLTDEESSGEDEFGNFSQSLIQSHKTGSNAQKYALFDSGAMAHFLVKGASVVNQQVTTTLLHIELPDGTYMESSHTWNHHIHAT